MLSHEMSIPLFFEPRLQLQHQLVKTVRDHVLTSPRSTYDGVYYVVRDMQTKTITSHGHLSGFGGVAHPNSPLLVFIDPCSDPEHPGWPLRNILALLSRKFSTRVSVLCYRGSGNNFDEDMTRSFVLDLELPGAPLSQISTIPKTVGWERNQQQKLAPRYMDLSASMDPVK